MFHSKNDCSRSSLIMLALAFSQCLGMRKGSPFPEQLLVISPQSLPGPKVTAHDFTPVLPSSSTCSYCQPSPFLVLKNLFMLLPQSLPRPRVSFHTVTPVLALSSIPCSPSTQSLPRPQVPVLTLNQVFVLAGSPVFAVIAAKQVGLTLT
jgi:hypothetical protein